MKIILWISLLALSFPFYSLNLPAVQVESSYFLDLDSEFSLANVQKQNFKLAKNFKHLAENQNINIGYNKNSAVWVRLKLVNKKNFEQKFWLVLDNNRLDSIQLFDKKQIALLGDRTTSNLPFLSYPAFYIILKPNSTVNYYLRIKKGISFLDFSYHLESDDSLQRRSNNFFFILSLTLGLILFLIVFNAVLFWITRKNIYLIYVIHSILSTIYILIATGFAKFVIFPKFLYFSEGLIYFGTIWFLILFVFLSSFLELKKNDPKIYKITRAIILLTSTYILSSIFFYANGALEWLKILSILNYVNFLLLIILIITAGIRHLKVNRNNAIYVLLSFLPHFIWSVTIIFKAFGLLSKELNINWLVVLSFYDILLFGFVLVRFYFDAFRKNRLLNEEIIAQKESEIQSIITTQINERQNISNLIHDQLGSSIGHIIHLHEQNSNANVNELLYDLSRNIREISHEIMPKALEDGALAHAMESQIQILNKTLNSNKIEFQSYDFPVLIDVKKAQNLYLIFLELINNARKHGGSNQIRIEFFGYDTTLLLQCSDDGKGFDKSSLKYGFGLSSIERRVHQMNGTIDIESQPLKGTIVQIELPKSPDSSELK